MVIVISSDEPLEGSMLAYYGVWHRSVLFYLEEFRTIYKWYICVWCNDIDCPCGWHKYFLNYLLELQLLGFPMKCIRSI